jgi:hypothetical protein
MIVERNSLAVPNCIDQDCQFCQGIVTGKFAFQLLPGVPGLRSMTSVQGIQHIVAEHDVVAVGEDVELHGGQRQKS